MPISRVHLTTRDSAIRLGAGLDHLSDCNHEVLYKLWYAPGDLLEDNYTTYRLL